MKEIFVPWHYALRSLALRSPRRGSTGAAPLAPPPGLEPPEALADAENGYQALAAHVREWPAEGHTAPDLIHRMRVLPNDRAASERALAPLRPLFEGLDPILAMPRWQVPVPEDLAWPELPSIRRLGYALLLRGALESRADDRERVLTLARWLRRAQSPMMHFLVGVSLEKAATGDFAGLEADRETTIRWELARVALPRLHRGGLWEPSPWELPADWLDDRHAQRWLLADHPYPYDPEATQATLVAERGLMVAGTSSELRTRADEIAAAWPEAMRSTLGGNAGGVPLIRLRRARPVLQSLPNAYGLLGIGRMLHAAASVAQAVERARPNPA